jgi:hypothetical protein
LTRRAALAALSAPLLLRAAADLKQPRLIRLTVRTTSAEPLDPKSFKVALERSNAAVVHVLTPNDPQMLLVVLDLVGDLGAIEPAKEALIAEIGKLPATTYVGVLRAQDGLSVIVDPTPEREPVTNAIRDLTISGRPGLLDALEPVGRLADSIARKAQVRVAVLHVSDSDVTGYREDFTNPVINSSDPHDLSRRFPETLIQEKMNKFEGRFLALQTPAHLVHLAYRSDRLNEAYQNGLQRLMEGLNGSAVFCRSRAEIGDAISAAFNSIRSEYGLIVAVPERIPEVPLVKVSAGDAALSSRARLRIKEK